MLLNPPFSDANSEELDAPTSNASFSPLAISDLLNSFVVITSLLLTIKFANYLESKPFFGSNNTQNSDAAKAAAIAVAAIKYSNKTKIGL